jgi:ABC-type spermidine/putrescine transport system permease subunit I
MTRRWRGFAMPDSMPAGFSSTPPLAYEEREHASEGRREREPSSGARPFRRPRVSVERAAVTTLTVLWMVGVLLPIFSLVVVSFLRGRGLDLTATFSLKAYADILVDYRIEPVLRTVRIVVVVTLIEFVLACPFALWLAKGLRDGWTKSILLVLLVVPFFLSPAARTIVWRPILGREGLINIILTTTGLTNHPLDWLLFSEFAIHLGLIGPYFPSMVWPLFISISLIDDGLIEASRDLGATAGETLRHVVLPLAMPGIAVGFIFTAVPMLGDNVVSTLLGGGQVSLIAEAFDDMIRAMNYPGAAALASLIVLAIVAIGLAIRVIARKRSAGADLFGRLHA